MKHLIILIAVLLPLISVSQNGIIEGKVTNIRSNDPIPFASVILQGSTVGTSTDLDGNYRLEELTPGLYNIEVSFIGFKPKKVFEIEVSNSRVANIDIQLEETTIEVGEAEVVGTTFTNREEAPVSLRRIGVNEVKRNPGGNRDISRAIQTLPGVASIPSFRNDVVIRGGAPNENRFYIDGIEIPNINHFATQGGSGGPVGLINVDFIDQVDFYSGAFPSSRGNALSSVLEFGFRDGRTDRNSLNAIIGSSDVGLTFEGPTGENSSLLISARRSYLQFLFAAIGLPFLPTYNDFQFKWKVDLDPKNRITVLGLGAIDDFELNTALGQDSTSEDFLANKYILDYLAINTQWNYTMGVKWDHFREKGNWTFVLSRNMLNNRAFKHENNDEALPLTINYISQEMENKFRVENRLFLENNWKFNYGVNYEFAKYNNSSDLSVYSYELDSIIGIQYDSQIDLHKYGAFAQLSKSFLENRMSVSTGFRMDGTNYSSSMSNPLEQFSPRFSASYYLTPELSWNFNTGMYFQLPTYTILGFRQDGNLVNQDVKYIRNWQLVTGFQYDIQDRNSVVTIEGFYKDYDRYPMSVDKQISLANLGADFGVVGDEAVSSTSEGRAYGVEFLYQQRLFKGFFGLVSYTFVRSEFTNGAGEYIPSSWDSRHIVSATGGKKFKRNFEVGFRFLYSGGLPYTPYDLNASLFIPNWNTTGLGIRDYSQLNSQRINSFHQMDIRIDKKWFFDKWNLNVFLDIQNVYNSTTPLQPSLDVVRDANGNPIEDVSNPGFYQSNFIDTSTGNLLPAIGIILEL